MFCPVKESPKFQDFIQISLISLTTELDILIADHVVWES